MATNTTSSSYYRFLPQDDFFVDPFITTVSTFLLSLLINMEFYLIIYHLIAIVSNCVLKPDINEISTTNYSTVGGQSTNARTKSRQSTDQWFNLLERIICFIATLIALIGLLISMSYLVLGFITIVTLIYIAKVYTCIRDKELCSRSTSSVEVVINVFLILIQGLAILFNLVYFIQVSMTKYSDTIGTILPA